MANDYSGSVIKLDTAGTTTDDVEVRHIISMSWEAVAGGDTIVVKDSNGKQLWSATATAEHLTIENPIGGSRSIPGVHASTISDGILYIYYR